jgi:hypothetical protein
MVSNPKATPKGIVTIVRVKRRISAPVRMGKAPSATAELKGGPWA